MIDMKKQYKTRRGNPVQVLSTTLPGSMPVAAAIMYSDNDCGVYSFTSEGRFFPETQHEWDLIEVKPVREGWINIYPGDTEWGLDNPGYEYSLKATRSQADKDASICTRLACIKITFTEGEGL